MKIKIKQNMVDRPYFLIFFTTVVTHGFYVIDMGGSYYSADYFGAVFSAMVGATIGLSIWLLHREIQKRGSVALLGSRVGWYFAGYGAYPFVFLLAAPFGFYFGCGFVNIGLEPYIFGRIAHMVLGLLSLFMCFTIIILPCVIIPCLLVASFGYLLGFLTQRLVQRLAGWMGIAGTDWRQEYQESGRRDWESLCPMLAFLWAILFFSLLKPW